jgi:predicted nuclease with TOPRIM domain
VQKFQQTHKDHLPPLENLKEICGLKKEISDLRVHYDRILDERDDLAYERDKLASNLAEAKELIAKVLTENAKLNNAQEYCKPLTIVEEDFEHLLKEKNDLEAQLAKLQTKYNHLNMGNSCVFDLQEEINDLEERLSASRQAYDELQAAYIELGRELDSFKEESANMDEEIFLLNANNADLKGKLSAAKKAFDDLQVGYKIFI